MMKKHRRAIEKRQDEFFEKKGKRLELKIIELKKMNKVQAQVIKSLKKQLEQLAEKNEK